MEKELSKNIKNLYESQLPSDIKIGGINKDFCYLENSLLDEQFLFERGVFLGTRGSFNKSLDKKVLLAGFKPSSTFNLSHIMFSKQLALFQKNGYLIYLISAISESALRKNKEEKIFRESEDTFLTYLNGASNFDISKSILIKDIDNPLINQFALNLTKTVKIKNLKKIFGMTESDYVSKYLFPFYITSNYLYPQLTDPNSETLILATLSHNPLITFTREIAEKKGYKKPAAIYTKCLRNISNNNLMSSNDPKNSILLSENIDQINYKLNHTRAGGKIIRDHRIEGGNTEECNYFMMHYFIDTYDHIYDIFSKCKQGILCESCKKKNIPSILEKVLKIKEKVNLD